MPISWKSNLCVVYLLLEHGLAQYTVLPRYTLTLFRRKQAVDELL